jgi:hypothetical protein
VLLERQTLPAGQRSEAISLFGALAVVQIPLYSGGAALYQDG